MKFKLDLYGIMLYLNITDYKKTTAANMYDEWGGTELYICNEENVILSVPDGGVFASYEIDYIKKSLKSLLDGNIKKITELEFIEPGIQIILHPGRDKDFDGEYNDKIKENEIIDIGVEVKIYFWYGSPTENYISVLLEREKIEKLYNYMRSVTFEASKDDFEIQKLIEEGTIYS